MAKRGIKKTNGIPATRISDLTLRLEPKPKGYTGRMGPMGQPEERQKRFPGGRQAWEGLRKLLAQLGMKKPEAFWKLLAQQDEKKPQPSFYSTPILDEGETVWGHT